MKKRIEGFIIARSYPWDLNDISFEFSEVDPRSEDGKKVYGDAHSVVKFVDEHALEFNLADGFDMRAEHVELLQSKKKALQERAAEEVANIELQIKNLLAIAN